MKKRSSAKPVHLLWALSFMQTYTTEENMAALFGVVDEKVMLEWVWFYANEISEMSLRVTIFLRI